VNIEGTQHLLSAAAASGVKHFLFASSGAVYADSSAPLSESDDISPVDVYGVSKMAGEQLCNIEANAGNLRITACRLFNNIGSRETNPHIVPEIIGQLKTGNTLRLGNINAIRDYISTGDTSEAFIRLSSHLPDPYRVINIGTGTGISVKKMIDLMAELLKRQLRVETDPDRFRKADKASQIADMTNLRDLLGWHPNMNLRNSLEDLFKFEGLL